MLSARILMILAESFQKLILWIDLEQLKER